MTPDYKHIYDLKVDDSIKVSDEVETLVVRIDNVQGDRFSVVNSQGQIKYYEYNIYIDMRTKKKKKPISLQFGFQTGDYGYQYMVGFIETFGIILWEPVLNRRREIRKNDKSRTLEAKIDIKLTRNKKPYITKVYDIKEV